MFSSSISKKLQPSSRSSQHRESAVRDGRMSFSSDRSTLLNVAVEFPESSLKNLPKYDQHVIRVEDDMIDPEDQAWGPPPPSSYKWSMPKFSRRKPSSRS